MSIWVSVLCCVVVQLNMLSSDLIESVAWKNFANKQTSLPALHTSRNCQFSTIFFAYECFELSKLCCLFLLEIYYRLIIIVRRKYYVENFAFSSFYDQRNWIDGENEAFSGEYKETTRRHDNKIVGVEFAQNCFLQTFSGI